jgi:hypothetical protein
LTISDQQSAASQVGLRAEFGGELLGHGLAITTLLDHMWMFPHKLQVLANWQAFPELSDVPGQKEGFYPIAWATQICFNWPLRVDHLAAARVCVVFPAQP